MSAIILLGAVVLLANAIALAMIFNHWDTNRDTLEQFAREQFHFAEPGEDVYIVEE